MAPAKKAAASEPVSRRKLGDKGHLQKDVKKITDKFTEGTLVIPDGKPLTPHRIAKLVQDMNKASEPPSTGAVTAVLKRWEESGFATMNPKPFSFKKYTPKGIKLGISGIMEERSAARKKATAERRAAAAPAKKAAAKKAPAKKAAAKKAAASKG